VAILVAVGAFAWLSAGDPRYTARTDLDLSMSATSVGSTTKAPDLDAQQLATQAALITARDTVAAALASAGTEGERVRAQAQVPPNEAAIIVLTVQADHGRTAVSSANAIAQQYIADQSARVKSASDAQITALTARDHELQGSLRAIADQMAAEQARIQAAAAVRGGSSSNSMLLVSLQQQYNRLVDQEVKVQDDLTTARQQQAGTAVPARQLNEAWVVASSERSLESRVLLAVGAGVLAALFVLWLIGVVARFLAVHGAPASHSALARPGETSVAT
jgi:uncharacterized protein involved in exopolysaccharide biosynthesis